MVLVCLIHTFLYSVRCWYACLSCFVLPVWLSSLLCIFACLPTCSFMSLCSLMLSILQSNGIMDTRSKPTFIRLGHPLLFDNMPVCPFHMLSTLCFPPFGSLCYCVLGILSLFPLFLPFFFTCTRMEHGYLEQGCDLLGASKKGKDACKKMQANQGQCSID